MVFFKYIILTPLAHSFNIYFGNLGANTPRYEEWRAFFVVSRASSWASILDGFAHIFWNIQGLLKIIFYTMVYFLATPVIYKVEAAKYIGGV